MNTNWIRRNFGRTRVAVISSKPFMLNWLALLIYLCFCPSVYAQTDQVFEPLGGSGGGQFFGRCPAGKYLAGFEAWVADDVDAIRPLCVTAYGSTQVGPLEPQPTKFGGSGGSFTRQLICPADSPVVTGMFVRSEGETRVVSSLHLFCGVAGATQQQNAMPAVAFDGPRANSATNLPVSSSQHCPVGLVAVGINGRSGIWLDAIGLICGVPRLTRPAEPPVPTSTPKTVVTSIGRLPAPSRSAYIYAVSNDAAGSLKWFRHDGAGSGEFNWQGPRIVNESWRDFKQIFGGGDGSIFALTKRGTLMFYQHPGFETGVGRGDMGDWPAPKQIATGWSNVVQAFSGGEGVIYAINPDGILNWYRYENGTLLGPRKVGRGWTDVRQAFSIGGGVIYSLRNDGTLHWFRHNGYLTGDGLEMSAAWTGPKQVGRGWNTYQQVFSIGNGIIYGIAIDGRLMWYRHKGFKDGSMIWDGPKQVGTGWQDFRHVFSQL